ncbi:Rossmann-fold NAD(P)-binding domain-containing protein [Chryseobacterium potabilaquae]|uniref:NAD dependent epimerase/dehydratase family protein n=1 Tax=Chryseobacterium potabilaquae TaxID=2675057 RepID=A0A6N4X511_9FLAO|nr:hypothetical protein [Chryseobacterium potabilaquae]CAA7194365.1 hypothetical protein CHRY9293_00697 [Chryseobacterium potabilaquae]
MIIGNGILANALIPYDRDDIIFFASGVSNSLETRNSEFEREITLLQTTLEKNANKKLVYFSTCSIYDSSKTQSPYVLHKLNIESKIVQDFENFAIFRIGNAIGKGGNPNTLINFLKNSIESRTKIWVHKNAGRSIIGVNDIALFINLHLNSINKKIINLSYPHQFAPIDIVFSLEKYLGRKACYEIINEGDFYDIEFEKLIYDYFENISATKYLDKTIALYI